MSDKKHDALAVDLAALDAVDELRRFPVRAAGDAEPAVAATVCPLSATPVRHAECAACRVSEVCR